MNAEVKCDLIQILLFLCHTQLNMCTQRNTQRILFKSGPLPPVQLLCNHPFKQKQTNDSSESRSLAHCKAELPMHLNTDIAYRLLL